MKIFGRGKKQEEKDEQFSGDMALTEASRQPQMSDEMIYSLGRSVYMVMDPEVTGILNAEGKDQFNALVPAFSHLNRTTNIDKKQAELLTLNYEYLSLIHKLNMKEDDYENVGWALLESLKIFAGGIISDAFHGWKGKLVTEQIKIIRTELEKKKKGWF